MPIYLKIRMYVITVFSFRKCLQYNHRSNVSPNHDLIFPSLSTMSWLFLKYLILLFYAFIFYRVFLELFGFWKNWGNSSWNCKCMKKIVFLWKEFTPIVCSYSVFPPYLRPLTVSRISNPCPNIMRPFCDINH